MVISNTQGGAEMNSLQNPQKLMDFLNRAIRIPNLQVRSKTVDDLYRFEKEFTLKMTYPDLSEISKNVVSFIDYSDSDFFGVSMPPWKFHKFCNYSIENFGMGMMKITRYVGKQVRKEKDWRYVDEIYNRRIPKPKKNSREEEEKVDMEEYYFFFDEDVKKWTHMGAVQGEEPKNSRWVERMEELKEFQNELTGFGYEFWIQYMGYSQYFFRPKNDLLEQDKTTFDDIRKFLKKTEDFLPYMVLYTDTALAAFGLIDKEEYLVVKDFLNQIPSLIQDCTEAIEELKRLENQMVSEKDKKPYRIYNPYFYQQEGLKNPFLKLYNHVRKILKHRQNNWQVFVTDCKLECGGYLKMTRHKLYPSLGEIIRRNCLTAEEDFWDTETEKARIEKIKSELSK
jgi:hypothetical protein